MKYKYVDTSKCMYLCKYIYTYQQNPIFLELSNGKLGIRLQDFYLQTVLIFSLSLHFSLNLLLFFHLFIYLTTFG